MQIKVTGDPKTGRIRLALTDDIYVEVTAEQVPYITASLIAAAISVNAGLPYPPVEGAKPVTFN